ncbi:hypothetical protein [Streptomyces sp. NPDC048248]|uniref:HalD/BesD family halogenase n=1 Tax=Streptomyces sp. NPDC048248 TaxID=3365523 RepID=UPI00371122EC
MLSLPDFSRDLHARFAADRYLPLPGLVRPGSLPALSAIAGWGAVRVCDPLERHVINSLHQQGDTHGGHTDDYPPALVLFTEAPDDPADGGLLEHVPHAGLGALTTGAVRSAHHRPGDGYLLRSDVCAHRVTPLRRSGLRRTVLNFAYTTPDRQAAITPSAPEPY